jgi:SAM-dependent methyltransferase
MNDPTQIQSDLERISSVLPHTPTVEAIIALYDFMTQWDDSLGLQESYSWDPDMCEPGPHLSAEPRELLRHINWLVSSDERLATVRQPIRPEEIRLVDLGSGYGFAVALFSAFGFQVYGIERHAGLAEVSRRRLDVASQRIAFHYTPEIVTADYYSRGIRFSDGKTLEDMHVVFMNCESDEVIAEVMAKLPVAPGTYLVLPPVGTSGLQRTGYVFLDDYFNSGVGSIARKLPTSSSVLTS